MFFSDEMTSKKWLKTFARDSVIQVSSLSAERVTQFAGARCTH
jgi:hypothetical protein